jgi:hypothetical protein
MQLLLLSLSMSRAEGALRPRSYGSPERSWVTRLVDFGVEAVTEPGRPSRCRGTMRLVALSLVLAAAVAAVAAHVARSSAPIVSCDAIVGQAATGHDSGYRVVLGVVSVPPARLTQVVETGSRRWAYWRKAGLVIRASTLPVRVSVPRAWRGRAAITWGDTGIVNGLTIAACPSPPGVWNAYAGGFYLRRRRQCVPLVFRVGARSQTVRFGVGGACPR